MQIQFAINLLGLCFHVRNYLLHILIIAVKILTAWANSSSIIWINQDELIAYS